MTLWSSYSVDWPTFWISVLLLVESLKRRCLLVDSIIIALCAQWSINCHWWLFHIIEPSSTLNHSAVRVCGINFKAVALETVDHELKTVLLFVSDNSIKIKQSPWFLLNSSTFISVRKKQFKKKYRMFIFFPILTTAWEIQSLKRPNIFKPGFTVDSNLRNSLVF